MNLSELLKSRQGLLRQAHLANLAFSYTALQRFAERVENARIHGRVRLKPTGDDDEATPASLTALDGNQSVIEEHFADEDIHHMADSIAFAIETPFSEIEFNLRDLSEKFAATLRHELHEAGVVIDRAEMVENDIPRLQQED